jgi:hypothetical protein
MRLITALHACCKHEAQSFPAIYSMCEGCTTTRNLAADLSALFLDTILCKLRRVGGIDLNGHADQVLHQGVLGAGVNHLWLNLGGIGGPKNATMQLKSATRCEVGIRHS